MKLNRVLCMMFLTILLSGCASNPEPGRLLGPEYTTRSTTFDRLRQKIEFKYHERLSTLEWLKEKVGGEGRAVSVIDALMKGESKLKAGELEEVDLLEKESPPDAQLYEYEFFDNSGHRDEGWLLTRKGALIKKVILNKLMPAE